MEFLTFGASAGFIGIENVDEADEKATARSQVQVGTSFRIRLHAVHDLSSLQEGRK